MTTVHTQATEVGTRGPEAIRAPHRPVRLRAPSRRHALGSDVWVVGLFVTAVTLAFWVRNGGWREVLAGGMGTVGALGGVTGLLAGLAALGAVWLTARPALIERRFGLDGLLRAHRWFGIGTVITVVTHGVLDSWAWWAVAPGLTPLGAVLDLLLQPWMVAATVAGGLFLIIGLTSWRRIKRRITYETWYFVHLLGYLAVLLGFGHQLVLGSDLSADPVMYWWWVALFVGTFVGVTWSRLVSLLCPLRQRFYVTAITREGPRTGALHLTGPGLRTLRASAGQFFVVRPLTRDLWWQGHPFSLSVPPNTAGLRFTIKELGDDTPSFLRLPLGTRVLLEGPYGVFTAAAAQGRKVILFGGGVGMAPVRAICEDCRPDQEPVVVARVHSEAELAHRGELEHLLAARNGRMHVLSGPRTWFADDPFSAEAIRAAVPDIAERHAFVCGPQALQRAIVSGLRRAGVPSAQIHVETFGE